MRLKGEINLYKRQHISLHNPLNSMYSNFVSRIWWSVKPDTKDRQTHSVETMAKFTASHATQRLGDFTVEYGNHKQILRTNELNIPRKVGQTNASLQWQYQCRTSMGERSPSDGITWDKVSVKVGLWCRELNLPFKC